MPNYNFSYKKKDRKAFLYGTLPKIHFRIKNCLAIYFYRKEVPNNTFYIKKMANITFLYIKMPYNTFLYYRWRTIHFSLKRKQKNAAIHVYFFKAQQYFLI